MKLIYLGIFALPAILHGCGNSNDLEGLYICDGAGAMKFEFKDGGRGYSTYNHEKTPFVYRIDGENLVVGSRVFTIEGKVLKGGNSFIGTCRKR